MMRKKTREKEEKAKEAIADIYEKWKKKWQEDENKEQKERDLFYLLFTATYENVCAKAEANKSKNFVVKMLFLVTVLLFPVLKILSVLRCIFRIYWERGMFEIYWGRNPDSIFTFDSVGVMMFSVLVAMIVAKWLDVKKYQETWVRHSGHKHKLEMEMFRFVSGLDDYIGLDNKTRFVRKVLEIWDVNQQKFADNMNKEKSMTDMLEYLKKK